MKNRTMTRVALTTLSLMSWAAGCKTSSHYSEYRYDFNGEPGAEARSERERMARDGKPASEYEADELTEEYQMVSPGKMIVEP